MHFVFVKELLIPILSKIRENIKETLCNVTNSSIFALIIVINSVIKGVRLQSTVRLQPYTMIGEK